MHVEEVLSLQQVPVAHELMKATACRDLVQQGHLQDRDSSQGSFCCLTSHMIIRSRSKDTILSDST